MKKVSLWQIFLTFFKVGAFTFGGGYAMISLLETELVSVKKWITSEDMLDMIVIAESTPGVIAVNTATGVGFRLRGILGAVIATIGVVLPSFVIISALSFALELIADNVWYKAAFTGVQACVIILILNAFLKLGKQLDKNWFSLILLAAAFAVSVFTNFDVIYLILIGGVLGVVYSFAKSAIDKKKALPLAENEKIDEAEENAAAESNPKAQNLCQTSDNNAKENALQDGEDKQ